MSGWDTKDAATIGQVGENAVIDRLAKIMSAKDESVLLSIGDDSAAFKARGATVLTSVDSMIEGQHFRKSWLSPTALGKRLYRVAASDLLAMGGTPRWLLLSMSVPGNATVRSLEAFFQSFDDECAKHKCSWIGGNITRSDQWALHVTVLGEPLHADGSLWTRSGAQPGDVLWLSGYPGHSAAGLALLLSGNQEDRFEALRASWRNPRDLSDFVRLAQRTQSINACMDVSDGLLMDASRMARASDVQSNVLMMRSSIPDDVRSAADALSESAIDWTLRGGESYELLFSSPEPPNEELIDQGAIVIGSVVTRNEDDDLAVVLEDGSSGTNNRLAQGWDPFRD